MIRTIDITLPGGGAGGGGGGGGAGGGSHRITIEPGLLRRGGELIHAVAPHRTAMLFVDSNIAASHAKTLRASLERSGYAVSELTLTATESHKSLAEASRAYDAMLREKIERASPVIALGGGIVGDLAGFVAATYLRGVPFVQVPTTLLAMVDASIGGKTGVNFPLPSSGHLGKNLIGAFWQPRAVLIDPRVLATLPLRDFRCGLAECVKHAIIAPPSSSPLLDWIESTADAITSLDERVLVELIDRSVRIKAAIVMEDEREAGRRALLNLGHTFAHVIETIEELELRHGEAVAIGLCAACHVAHRVGRLELTDAERIQNLLEALGLPTKIKRPLDAQSLFELMQYDKKASGGRMRLILPSGIGNASIESNIEPSVVLEAWRAVGAASNRSANGR